MGNCDDARLRIRFRSSRSIDPSHKWPTTYKQSGNSMEPINRPVISFPNPPEAQKEEEEEEEKEEEEEGGEEEEGEDCSRLEE